MLMHYVDSVEDCQLYDIASKYVLGSYSIIDVANLIGDKAHSDQFYTAVCEAREDYEYYLRCVKFYNECAQHTTIKDIPEEAWEEANHQYTDVELQKAYNEWEKKRLKYIGRIAEQAFKLEFVSYNMIYKFFEDYRLTPNEVRIFWRDYYSLFYNTDL